MQPALASNAGAARPRKRYRYDYRFSLRDGARARQKPAGGRAPCAWRLHPLFGAVQGIVELDDGYSFAFPGDALWAGRLLEFMLAVARLLPIKALLAADWLAHVPGGSGSPAVRRAAV